VFHLTKSITFIITCMKNLSLSNTLERALNNMHLFKKLLLAAMLVIICNLSFAQGTYHDIAFRIDSLANVGLPKSALTEVTKLDVLARKNKNSPQIIRAVIYRITFQSYIEENSIIAIIDTLKADIQKSAYPVKPILQSLLADMYWKYYQQNRYQFYQRSQLDKPDSDFTRWDLRTIINETGRLYQLSLTDAVIEQHTPIDVLDGVLTGDKSTRYLRPTLYDLLIQRAFEFFLTDEPALPKPKFPFNLNDNRFFSDSRTFANLVIRTTDTVSTHYKGIKYLQQATLFHLEKNDREALADLDLKRLGFLYAKSSAVYKDSLYLQALNQLIKTFADKPISTDALVSIGKYYQQRDSLKMAFDYFQKAVKTYPESIGGQNAATLLNQVQERTLLAITENVNLPGKPILGQLQYKNVKAVNVLLYKLSQQQLVRYRNLLDINSRNGREANSKTDSASVFKYLAQFKPVQNKTSQLPGIEDYRRHTTEFKIDTLQHGNYVLLVKDVLLNDSTLFQLADFKVSRLAYVARETPDGQTEVRVMDRETGAPVKGAVVTINGASYSNSQPRIENGITDAQGQYKDVHFDNNKISIVFKGDTLIDNNTYISGQVYRDDDHAINRTLFFTDRQIYRPGQTLYFKGLQLFTSKSGTIIVPNKPIDVDFIDNNQKVISKASFETNEYGTFSGSFVIPQNILNGQVTIKTHDGLFGVRVEEYKRPTFNIIFAALKDSYHFNDTVVVKGKVSAFSGYGLSGARVAYHITRTSLPVREPLHNIYGSIYYYEEPAEIAADILITDDQGNYTIKFKAIPGDNAYKYSVLYNYTLNADITDASGETHSNTIVVNIGSKNMQLNADMPAYLFAKDPAKFSMDLVTLNKHKLSGTISVQIYKLQAPGRLFKKRLWGMPDKYLLSQQEYESFFPGYTYKNEDEFQAWAIQQKVAEINAIATEDKETLVDLSQIKQQPSGEYKLVINARSNKDETDTLIKYIYVDNELAAPQVMDNWLMPVTKSVIAGDNAEFLIGIGSEVHVLMEKYHSENLLSSQWLTLNSQQRFKVPVTAEDGDNTVVQLLMVYQNRLYTSYQKINVIKTDQLLNLKMLSFRDVLQPGQKEQWKIQISVYKNEKQAAEMVAGLYDASLDDITQPQKWDDALLIPGNRQTNYFNWNGYGFVLQQQSRSLFYKYNYYTQAEHNYEVLNLFGYDYYGGYNRGYMQYLNSLKEKELQAANDKKLESDYKKNAALVKNGYEISGRVVDATNQPLPGVTIKIEGTKINTLSNSEGYFKLKVPVNARLSFAYIGYANQLILTKKADKITVVLTANGNALNEVSVVGYGTQARTSVTAAPAQVRIRGTNSLQEESNKVFESVETVMPDGTIVRNGRGITSVRLSGKDFSAGASAYPVRNLPADILKGIQVIDDYGNQARSITPRTNFNETAFFYPQLHTDANGQILIDFTIPESLTKWRFMALAHTKDLKTGYIEKEIVTQKQLSVTANMPRFLREGDTVTVSARLANLTSAALKGKVNLQLFNAITMKPILLLLNAADAQQSFELAAATNKAVSFKLYIPAGLDALTYRITAAAGNYSDGEENTLPVLPNRMLVTETMPMMVRAGQTKNFTFDKLVNENSKTLINKSLTLEYTQNPAWYAVQALPYMMEYPYECSEQIFSRYYANSLATGLVNKMPVIKRVFDQWKLTNSAELLSNLEKNQELKATLIEETPWLRAAENETEQKKRVALLFDLNKMSYELKLNIDKLKEKQLPDGGFPWFGGNTTDSYITRYILAGLGQLYQLNMIDPKDQTVKTIVDKAANYLDNDLIAIAKREKGNNAYDNRTLNSAEIHAWYTESYFTNHKHNTELQGLLVNYLELATRQWNTQGIYEQGMIALTLLRNKKADVAQMIIRSLLETAQQSDDMGMYWAKNQLGYYWYQSPVETQSLMIELFTEAGNQLKAIEEMKIWLLRNKQTGNWKTTKATAQACYALLMKGDSLLTSTNASTIKLDGKMLTELKPDIKADKGTGYFKTGWVEEQIKPTLGKVEITNNSKTISWGTMYWQYTEKMDMITASKTDIQLERKYFIEKQTDAGSVLTAVDATHTPKTGDMLKVVVYLKAGRDFEYVQLKDMRPAGTEPVDVLSAYKYQDGLYYYQVTKDVATNFFISQVNKGNYVFEYRLRVVQSGNYSTGISTVQSMYAPEFSAHSEGTRLVIGK
jgi:uncharacterized protein YfaS (alpha-2-macroglobulin family)